MAATDDRPELADELADAFLASVWTSEGVAEGGAACVGHWPRWMAGLAERAVGLFRSAPLDRRDELSALILDFLSAHVEAGEATRWRASQAIAGPPLRAGVEVSSAPRWPVPRIGSVAELAQRLELSLGQLDWLADVRELEHTVEHEQLRNYRYRVLTRRSGLPRLIEAPKLRLKEIQRWLVGNILAEVPVHPSAHGFVAGRSVRTHAELHTGQRALLRLDIKDFFTSVPAGRIYRLWRSLGYPRSVAHVLTGLTTNVVPALVWQRVAESTDARAVPERFRLGRQLATPHLPQGAPTSPALANLTAFRLDRRLNGLAQASGLSYSRYADDLTFSGPARLIRRRQQFEELVREILRNEGFAINDTKTVLQASGGRQTVCGVVVNARVNVRRTEYDEIRAILHNAAELGPASQNRGQVEDFRTHLLGRISWVQSLNPVRGRRLLELFAAIDWSR